VTPTRCHSLDGPGEAVGHPVGDRVEVGVVDHREHHAGVDRAHTHLSVVRSRLLAARRFRDAGRLLPFVDDHVAGQQRPEFECLAHRLVGQRRVARAEDGIVPEVLVEVLLRGRLRVDTTEDAEPLLSQRLDDPEAVRSALDGREVGAGAGAATDTGAETDDGWTRQGDPPSRRTGPYSAPGPRPTADRQRSRSNCSLLVR
jgi:hypothetical protein